MSTLTDEPPLSIPAVTESPSRGFQRRLAAIGVLVTAALAALGIGISVGLETTERPPATGAAALVPSDALFYVHLSTDPSRPAVKRAIRLAARFPDLPVLTAALTGRLGAILRGGSGSAGAPFDFRADVEPWLGNEAAFALLNTPSTTAGSLIVLSVRSRARALAFLQSSGVHSAGSYRGVPLFRYRPGTVLGFVGRYLALGQRASVKRAIDAASLRSQSLQRSASYRSAASTEPADRVLDAYISETGVRRVLAPRGGVLGGLAALLTGPALSGTAISLSAVPGGARVTVHSALDPTLARISGPPPPQFAPTLGSLLPAHSPLMFDVRGLARAAPRILAATAAAGIAPRIGPLLRRLGMALSSEGVDVRQAEAMFSGETAVALSSERSASGRPAHGPALLIIARTGHPGGTRTLLATLEGPLAQLFPPPAAGPGQAPVWNELQVDGVGVHQLAIAPGLELDYAVFRGLVVVSTSLRAIRAVTRHARSLAGESAYRTTLGGTPDQVTSLLFLDFSQLLSLGERTGLTRGARLSALRPDLQKIRAIGLASSRGKADTTAQLVLQIP